MNRLVVHHRYAMGTAFDLSGNRNHGIPVDVLPGDDAFEHSLEFFSEDSRVEIPRSESLAEVSGFRTRVTFHPTVLAGRRRNLAESQLSFALFVNEDGSVQGTILDATGTWSGITTAPGLIEPGHWYDVDYSHDGCQTAWLNVDGALVASSNGIPGPVRPLGERGVTVGHWAELDPQYALEGFVSEFWLWALDPEPGPETLFDPCCADAAALDRVRAAMAEAGWTRADVEAGLRPLLALASSLTQAYVKSDASRIGRLSALSRAALAALRGRDRDALDAARNTIFRELRTLSPETFRAYRQRWIELTADLPRLDDAVAADLVAALCLEPLSDPPDRVEEVRHPPGLPADPVGTTDPPAPAAPATPPDPRTGRPGGVEPFPVFPFPGEEGPPL